jgi:hypothetical protein
MTKLIMTFGNTSNRLKHHSEICDVKFGDMDFLEVIDSGDTTDFRSKFRLSDEMIKSLKQIEHFFCGILMYQCMFCCKMDNHPRKQITLLLSLILKQ